MRKRDHESRMHSRWWIIIYLSGVVALFIANAPTAQDGSSLGPNLSVGPTWRPDRLDQKPSQAICVVVLRISAPLLSRPPYAHPWAFKDALQLQRFEWLAACRTGKPPCYAPHDAPEMTGWEWPMRTMPMRMNHWQEGAACART
jgi:hypothetical protein